MTRLYRGRGLAIYERSHYSRGEHVEEVDQILRWYRKPGGRLLDLGCSGGLHALEFARRGFSVVGVDVEPSAVQLAGSRAARQSGRAEFLVLDVERADLSCLGKFDLVYSLGNVVSHFRRAQVGAVLEKVRAVMAPGGSFLFDALAMESDLAAEVDEPGTNILWTRALDPHTGDILLEGYFRDQGFRQTFRLRGYTAEEMSQALRTAGFTRVEVSRRLDFGPEPPEEASACLRYRAE